MDFVFFKQGRRENDLARSSRGVERTSAACTEVFIIITKRYACFWAVPDAPNAIFRICFIPPPQMLQFMLPPTMIL